MKITLIMVSSVDGKTTQWFNPHLHFWTSKEDQEYFYSLIKNAQVIIMGRKTYEVVKQSIKHNEGRLRIILTREPAKHQEEAIPGQLEFTHDDPKELVKKLEKRGFSNALLVGGAHANTDFLKLGVVNELWLTLEPKLFGKGNGIVLDTELHIELELSGVEKLNSQGTLLLKYVVKYLSP